METYLLFLVSEVYYCYICPMDAKKLEILERASSVYMKYGIKSITMDDLASELGISKKTIYKYFTDKNELILSIIVLKAEMDKAMCLECQLSSINAIDNLINISSLVVEHLGNVNSTVFYDLKKYYPDAWSILETHKWEFILSMIRDNINKGIEEKLYREDLNPNIISRLYVASTDALLDTSVFPWPEYQFQDVFSQMIHLQICGMVNEKGRDYLKQKQ